MPGLPVLPAAPRTDDGPRVPLALRGEELARDPSRAAAGRLEPLAHGRVPLALTSRAPGRGHHGHHRQSPRRSHVPLPVSPDLPGGPWGRTATRRTPMREQRKVPRHPASDEESPPAGPGDDSGQPGKVRTQGETAVDEAMGTGDNVH